jgi:hypothetical protein
MADEQALRRRKADQWPSVLGRYAAVIAATVSLFVIGEKLITIGSSIQSVNDNVVLYANRNCQVSAGIVQALRVTISTEIRDPIDRDRVLTLFPPVSCPAPLKAR